PTPRPPARRCGAAPHRMATRGPFGNSGTSRGRRTVGVPRRLSSARGSTELTPVSSPTYSLATGTPTGMNFPPPSPWKLVAAVDPTREYVAFASAFHLKSPRRVPAFIRRSFKIIKQADAASGIVGWSLGQNIFKLDFYTLSVWQDAESLRHFVRDCDHLAS